MMLKPYLLVFHPSTQSRQEILNFLDTRSEVLNWFAWGDTGIFLISEESAYLLSNIIHEKFPNIIFVITLLPTGNYLTVNGWLFKNNWDFINDPKSSGRWNK